MSHIFKKWIRPLKIVKIADFTSFSMALSTTCLVLCLITQIIISIQFPIFTDELCNLIINSRFFYDGAMRPTVQPECQLGAQGTPIPISIIPGHILNSMYHSWINSPMKLKYLGILQFLVWLFLILIIRKSVNKEENHFSRLNYLFLPLSGSIPISLVMARQEPTIAIIITIATIIILNRYSNIISKIFLYLAPSWLVILHPKAVLLFPLFVYSSLTNFKSRLQRLLYVTWQSILIFQTYYFYKAALTCNENAALNQYTQSQNKLSSLENILSAPLQFIGSGCANIIKQLMVSLAHPIYYDWTGLYNYFGGNYLFFRILISGLLLFYFYLPIQNAIHNINKNIKPNDATIISYILLFCFLSSSFLQNYYYFYNSSYSYFIIFLIGSLLAPGFNIKSSSINLIFFIHKICLFFICAFWLTNSKIFEISDSWEKILPSTIENGFIPSDQDSSENEKIIKAANICEINTEKSNRLLIDESTYFAFKQNKLPVMTRYTWITYKKEKPEISFPEKLEIFSGFIGKCKFLPKEIALESNKVGEYCCKSFKK